MRLIIGGDGTIGSALFRYWHSSKVPCHTSSRNRRSTSPHHLYFDLAKPDWTLFSAQYTGAVIVAGITSIAECESNPSFSKSINVDNSIELAKRLARNGCYILFLSSTQVFDGTKPFRKTTDEVTPITEYGRQKVIAERGILELEKSGVLRLTKVIGYSDDLIERWRHKLTNEEPIYPYTNVCISPLSIHDAVLTISNIVTNERTGIWHQGTTRELTYADFASELCKDWGFDSSLIRPIKKEGILGIEHSSLSCF